MKEASDEVTMKDSKSPCIIFSIYGLSTMYDIAEKKLKKWRGKKLNFGILRDAIDYLYTDNYSELECLYGNLFIVKYDENMYNSNNHNFIWWNEHLRTIDKLIHIYKFIILEHYFYISKNKIFIHYLRNKCSIKDQSIVLEYFHYYYYNNEDINIEDIHEKFKLLINNLN